MRILVTGYYGYSNLGDDAFQEALPKILGFGERRQYTFLHLDQYAVEKDINSRFDLVALGGGDVVLPYFLDKMKQNPFTNGPVILFGAGITYPSCVALGHLDSFDKVFLRNTTDLRLAERRLGIKHVHFVPDLAFALEPAPPLAAQNVRNGRPKAGFFPIASIYEGKPDSTERQQHVLYQLAQCVSFVARTHDVHLVRFNTSGKRDSDDKFICEKLIDMCRNSVPSGALYYDNTQYKSPREMMQCMSKFDVNVCMRFHSHVFSIVQGVPFVSLALTRKVRMLMEETGLDSTCTVPLDQDCNTLRPLNLSVSKFTRRFNYVTTNREQLRDRLTFIYEQRNCLLLSGVYARLVEQTKPRSVRVAAAVVSSRALSARGTSVSTTDESRQLLDKLTAQASASWKRRLRFSLDAADSCQEQKIEPASTRALPGNGANRDDEEQNKNNGDEIKQKAPPLVGKSTFELTPLRSRQKVEQQVTRICKRAIFGITGQVESSYVWGFVQNMLRDPFKIGDYLEWIWKDHKEGGGDATKPTKNTERSLYFDYMQQEVGSKVHRSGWPFVVQHMRSLESKTGVLCDMYVDRTFHWGFDVLRKSAVVPYTKSWIGFVHHTPITEYSDFNVVSMLNNPMFRASLLTCRALFVLSDYLKQWFDQHLQALNLDRPLPVRVLCHPTQMPTDEECFTMQKFLDNKDRKLVHIGAWLRDTFALYDLAVMDNAERALRYARTSLASGKANEQMGHRSERWRQSVGYILVGRHKKRLRRCVLRGRNMGLYMPPEYICVDDCQAICQSDDESNGEKNVNDDTSSSADSSNTSSTSSSDSVNICRHKCSKTCLVGSGDGVDEKKAGDETKCTNKWIEGLRQHVNDTVAAGVDVLEHLSNDEYDRLLQENIVFLCLQDASACNTLVECVVRNTPLLINRLPAVEEVLGADYPFYYGTLSEALLKSRDYQLIQKTHEYMCQLDKTIFRIESFINAMRCSDVYQQL